jgi:5'-3' exonuclease
VLLVDGTNVGALSASSAKQPVPERFAAWLHFLAAAAAGDSPGGTLSAVVVAFDTKGSTLTNVRAQQLPGYLSRRHSSASSSSSSSGFAELAGVVEQQQWPGCGPFLACHAAFGFEADDVLAAAASWVRRVLRCCQSAQVPVAPRTHARNHALAAACHCITQCSTSLAPRPDVIIASSDSDVAQLLDDSTHWLQLLQVC